MAEKARLARELGSFEEARFEDLTATEKELQELQPHLLSIQRPHPTLF